MRELAQTIVGAIALALLIWEGIRTIRAIRAAQRDSESPALFLRAVRLAIVLTGGFCAELLVTSGRITFFAAICGIAALVLTAIYFMVRHVEGTGDQPKPRD